MNLREAYRNSFLGGGLSFLLADNVAIPLDDSFVGRLFRKIPTLPQISYLLIIVSVFLLWYEKPLEALWVPLGNDFVPFALILVSFIFSPKKDFVFRKYHLWYFGFLVSAIIAGVVGALKGYEHLEVLWGLAIYLQFGLVLFLGNFWAEKKRMTADFLILSLPLIIKGVWQASKGQGSGYSYLETAGTRIDSFVANPNIFGFILVLLCLMLWQYIVEKKNKRWVLGYLPLSVLLFLTGSRTAWLALGVVLLIVVIYRNWHYLLLAPLLLLGILVPRVRERIAIVFSRNYLFDSSIDGRLWSLKNALHIWSQNIFGTGPGTYGGRIAQMKASPVYLQSIQNGYTALYTTDNQWLAVLVQTGILGILSFIGLFIGMLVALFKDRKVFGIALIASFVVMMTFSNALEFGAVVVPVGLLLGKNLAE